MAATGNTLQGLIRSQQHAVWDESHRDAVPRKTRIKKALTLLNDNAEAIASAINADFGNRAATQSLLVDVPAPIASLKHALKNVEGWMQNKGVAVESWREQAGASAQVQYQPLGSVGVMSPWNFPVNLVFSPLASIFAAGNRAIIKPSELTPRTSQLLAELAAKYFVPEELAVIEGGADVAAQFAAQPFDHLLYTGGGEVAKKVMQAAAANLTPVTLELGGKCPVIVEACAKWINQLTSATASGGVSVNDVIAHYQIDDLPFGGVGYSGMGVYHSFDGFRNFSHARAVYTQVTGDDIIGLLRPPYDNPILQGFLVSQIGQSKIKPAK